MPSLLGVWLSFKRLTQLSFPRRFPIVQFPNLPLIVAFLAVLEMVKMQAIALAQEKQFGEIVLKKGKSFELVFDESGGLRQIDEEYK